MEWRGRGGAQADAPTDQRVFLECRRSSFNSAPLQDHDAVDVFRSNGDAPVLNIPWPKYGPDEMPVPTLVDMRRAMEQELRAMEQELDALRTVVRQTAVRSIFGDWVSIAIDSTRMADTDGMVVAFSEGDGEFGLWVGERADNLLLRTRGGAQEGTATPVKVGQHYRVSTNGSAVTAWWMPIIR